MGKVAVTESHLENIADSIRAKAGTQSTYTPAQMSAAIDDIPSSDLSEYFNDTMVLPGTSSKPGFFSLLKKIKSPVTISSGNLQYAFYNYPCTTLPIINVPPNISITSLNSAFGSCDKLTSLNLNYLDVSDVVNCINCFDNCTNLVDIDLSNWTLSSVTEITNMFSNNRNLERINVPRCNTGSLEKIGNAFGQCSKLISLDLSTWDTSNVGPTTYDMNAVFNNCVSLETVNVSTWDTSNVMDMGSMFAYCKKLKTLDVSNFDMGKVQRIAQFIYTWGGTELTDLSFGYDLGKGYLTTASANYSNYQLDFSGHTKLTHDSLMSVINGLYDIASAGVQPQRLIMGNTNLAKLTATEIAIATNKGWTVS